MKADLQQIEFAVVPTSSIFVDAVEEVIHAGNKREPHVDGPGYQRDPYLRINWIERHSKKHFRESLFRPLNVSDRGNGKYAVVDGAGRWLIAQETGLHKVPCMVHRGLTRKIEGQLFNSLDREIYRLSAVNTFLACLAAGFPDHRKITESIQPYHVGSSAKSSLSCVGVLYDLHCYEGGNGRLLTRTAKVMANTWGGYTGDGQWSGDSISGIGMLAIALVLDAGVGIEGKLRNCLMKPGNRFRSLLAKANKDLAGNLHITPVQRARVVAEQIGRKIGVSFDDIRRCGFFEFLSGRTGRSMDTRNGTQKRPYRIEFPMPPR